MVELKENGITFSNEFGIKKIDGHEIFFDPKDKILLNHLANYDYSEKLLSRAIKNNLKKDMNGINIGANIGYYTLLMAKQVGSNGRIFSFEPFLPNCRMLEKNIQKNGYQNVTVIPKAVSDKPGVEELSIPTTSCLHNVLSASNRPNTKYTEKVEVISIDEFLNDKNVIIDFVMIDAEGSETSILKGMQQTINNNPDMDLIIEYHEYALRLVGTSGKDLLKTIADFGFYIFNIDNIDNKIKATTMEEMLKKYPYENEQTKFTNLYLTKNQNKFRNSLGQI